MATVIIGTLVLSAFAFVGYYTYKEHKAGKCCSGGCSGCTNSCEYHKHLK